MANRPAQIRQSDVTRLLKGIIAGGVSPVRIVIEGGKITVYANTDAANDDASPLDEWRRKNGEG